MNKFIQYKNNYQDQVFERHTSNYMCLISDNSLADYE